MVVPTAPAFPIDLSELTHGKCNQIMNALGIPACSPNFSFLSTPPCVKNISSPISLFFPARTPLPSLVWIPFPQRHKYAFPVNAVAREVPTSSDLHGKALLKP